MATGAICAARHGSERRAPVAHHEAKEQVHGERHGHEQARALAVGVQRDDHERHVQDVVEQRDDGRPHKDAHLRAAVEEEGRLADRGKEQRAIHHDRVHAAKAEAGCANRGRGKRAAQAGSARKDVESSNLREAPDGPAMDAERSLKIFGPPRRMSLSAAFSLLQWGEKKNRFACAGSVKAQRCCGLRHTPSAVPERTRRSSR